MQSRSEDADKIPWRSLGRESVASNVARGLLPVGVYPFDPAPFVAGNFPHVLNHDPNFEQYLMDIVGTAIQSDDGKFVTCAHVVEALDSQGKPPMILSRFMKEDTPVFIPYPLQGAVKYIDPLTSKPNPGVDLAVLITNIRSTPEIPYESRKVQWGDSSNVGIGDEVVIGGFPYGKEMFLFTKSNRGFIQPTFYNGIISAIIPATKPTETRLFQISAVSAGGMSGGAVFYPNTGEVIGMITSCVQVNGIPQPMSYAIPSEVIVPFFQRIGFS